MSFIPVPTQSNVQVALRSFLLSILPVGVEIVEGQDNQVPEPSAGNFVVMTTIRRERLETNIDSYADCVFTASVAGTVMTVTAMQYGSIVVGRALFGVGATLGTAITAQTGGTPGGAGTYTVSTAQTIASKTLAAGAEFILQPTKITVQLDVHSSSVTTASDMAQTISTLMRDEYATSFFTASVLDVIPLYADDPKQIPFLNAEQNFETRYVVEAVLQANQVITPPQQFASVVDIGINVVEAVFPTDSGPSYDFAIPDNSMYAPQI